MECKRWRGALATTVHTQPCRLLLCVLSQGQPINSKEDNLQNQFFPLESDRIYLAVVVKLKRQDNTQKSRQKAKTWHFAQNYHFTTSSQFLKFHKCHCCFRNAWRLRTHRGKSGLGRGVLESWRAPNLLGIPCETNSHRLVSEGNCGDGVQQRC